MKIYQLLESMSSYEMNMDKAYELFSKSYTESTGTSWSKEKFLSRARGWVFYGDDNGYVAVRPQRSGMKKLVGMAGDIRSILKGMDELIQEGGPVWGAVSAPLAKAAKKRGMIVPHLIMGGPFFIKTLIKTIPASVFGGHEPKVTSDGGITIEYDDVGAATKYLIGNKAYFISALKIPEVAEKIKTIPGISSILKLMGLKA